MYMEINIERTVSCTNIRQISRANKATNDNRKAYDEIKANIL